MTATRKLKLHCYHIPPIDLWFGALKAPELLATAWKGFAQDWKLIAAACQHIDRLENPARPAFESIGWEGDVREGPSYFALPGEVEMSIGYIVKQDNNGNCFAASPVAMPQLEDLAMGKTEVYMEGG